MNAEALLRETAARGASDLHLTVGAPPMLRLNGGFIPLAETPLANEDIAAIVNEILSANERDVLFGSGEIDFSIGQTGIGRFRVNAFRQRGSYALAVRSIGADIPDIGSLGLPGAVKELITKKRGLILVTGPTGSGKSTTLASMIDYINKNIQAHILTLEDPIEFLHTHKKSIVNQREVGKDSASFASALRAALRQDPDVILVGEMRDLETISTAITAAETGHLVLSTLHTSGAVKTVDRMIDVFPPHQQQQIRAQLAGALEGVISQQLIRRQDEKGRVAAFELMTATPAVRSLIREGKTHQLMSAMQTGAKSGMVSMDQSLIRLHKDRLISEEEMLVNAANRGEIEKLLY